jgi:hypothetical protein
MSSLWKDLLYLQGYMIRRDALQWRPDAQSGPQRGQAVPKKARVATVAPPDRQASNDAKPLCA